MPIAYLAGLKALLSLVGVAVVTSTLSNVDLTGLATMGAKEVSSFGGGFLFCFMTYLRGSGWGSLSATERLKAALGDPDGGGGQCHLRPNGVYESYEENSKYLGLFGPRLPLTTSAVGKELMVVNQPILESEVCIPGMLGFWDEEAATAFAAAKEEKAATFCVVPDTLQMQEKVCIAGAVGAWTEPNLTHDFNIINTATRFFIRFITTLVHFVMTLGRVVNIVLDSLSNVFKQLIVPKPARLFDASYRILTNGFIDHFNVFVQSFLAALPWMLLLLLLLTASVSLNIYQHKMSKITNPIAFNSSLLIMAPTPTDLDFVVNAAELDDNHSVLFATSDRSTTNIVSMIASGKAHFSKSHSSTTTTTTTTPINTAPVAATDADENPISSVAASTVTEDATVYELPIPITASFVLAAIFVARMNAAHRSENPVPAQEEKQGSKEVEEKQEEQEEQEQIEEEPVRVLNKGKGRAIEIEDEDEDSHAVEDDEDDVIYAANLAEARRLSLEDLSLSSGASSSMWVPQFSTGASSSRAANSSTTHEPPSCAGVSSSTWAPQACASASSSSSILSIISQGSASSVPKATCSASNVKTDRRLSLTQFPPTKGVSSSMWAPQASVGASTSKVSKSPSQLSSTIPRASKLSGSSTSNDKTKSATKKVARQLIYHQPPAPAPPPSGPTIKWKPGVPFTAPPTERVLAALKAKDPRESCLDKRTRAMLEEIPAPPPPMRDARDLADLSSEGLLRNMRASKSSFNAWKARQK